VPVIHNLYTLLLLNTVINPQFIGIKRMLLDKPIKKNDIIYPESPEFMMEQYKKLIDLGVSILGGCCGTTEKHIFEFSKIVRSHNESI